MDARSVWSTRFDCGTCFDLKWSICWPGPDSRSSISMPATIEASTDRSIRASWSLWPERVQFDEGLCHDYWRDLWPADPGASLAHHRGKAESGDGPLVRSHHRCRGGTMSLGLAAASAVEAVMTTTVTCWEERSPEARGESPDSDPWRASRRAGPLHQGNKDRLVTCSIVLVQ